MPAATRTLCNAGLPGLSPSLIAPGRFPSSKVHLLRPHKSSLHITNKNIPPQTPRGKISNRNKTLRGERGGANPKEPAGWAGTRGTLRPGQVMNSQHPGRARLGGRRSVRQRPGKGRCPEPRGPAGDLSLGEGAWARGGRGTGVGTEVRGKSPLGVCAEADARRAGRKRGAS